jgi:hypothetical protein
MSKIVSYSNYINVLYWLTYYYKWFPIYKPRCLNIRGVSIISATGAAMYTAVATRCNVGDSTSKSVHKIPCSWMDMLTF